MWPALRHGTLRWTSDSLAENRRRERRLRLELPVRIRWWDGAGRPWEAAGVTQDVSKSGVYFLVPVEVDLPKPLELGVQLPEEIIPGGGMEVCYRAKSLRKERLNGSKPLVVPTVGVAARLLGVASAAGHGS